MELLPQPVIIEKYLTNVTVEVHDNQYTIYNQSFNSMGRLNFHWENSSDLSLFISPKEYPTIETYTEINNTDSIFDDNNKEGCSIVTIQTNFHNTSLKELEDSFYKETIQYMNNENNNSKQEESVLSIFNKYQTLLTSVLSTLYEVNPSIDNDMNYEIKNIQQIPMCSTSLQTLSCVLQLINIHYFSNNVDTHTISDWLQTYLCSTPSMTLYEGLTCSREPVSNSQFYVYLKTLVLYGNLSLLLQFLTALQPILGEFRTDEYLRSLLDIVQQYENFNLFHDSISSLYEEINLQDVNPLFKETLSIMAGDLFVINQNTSTWYEYLNVYVTYVNPNLTKDELISLLNTMNYDDEFFTVYKEMLHQNIIPLIPFLLSIQLPSVSFYIIFILHKNGDLVHYPRILLSSLLQYSTVANMQYIAFFFKEICHTNKSLLQELVYSILTHYYISTKEDYDYIKEYLNIPCLISLIPSVFSSYVIQAFNQQDLLTYCNTQLDIIRGMSSIPKYYTHSFYYINNYLSHLLEDFMKDKNDVYIRMFASLFNQNNEILSSIYEYRYIRNVYDIYMIQQDINELYKSTLNQSIYINLIQLWCNQLCQLLSSSLPLLVQVFVLRSMYSLLQLIKNDNMCTKCLNTVTITTLMQCIQDFEYNPNAYQYSELISNNDIKSLKELLLSLLATTYMNDI